MHGFTVGLHRSWERRAEDRHSKSQNENGCGQVTINRWITKGVCLTMLLIIYEQKHIDEKIIVILSFNSQQMPYCTTYTSNCTPRNPDTWSGSFMGLFTTSWPKWKPKTWSGFATPERVRHRSGLPMNQTECFGCWCGFWTEAEMLIYPLVFLKAQNKKPVS